MPPVSRWEVEGEGPIRIERDDHGVPHVHATSEADLYRGLGSCHGTDRALQLLVLRVLAQGRGSELLSASEEMLGVDRFFRRLDLTGGAAQEAERLPTADRALLEAYCDGLNGALRKRIPWELRLLGYRRPEPWSAADSISVARVIGYVGLAQSQGEMERLLVELVQAGVPRAHLEELFPGHLDGLDEDLLREVRLGERMVPAGIALGGPVPHAVASNNWAIAAARSASGGALLANDPHLEVNRLPAVWCEVVVSLEDRFCVAATMPGIPGFLLGRTNDLAWGATYAFMDAIDSWVEDCRDGSRRVQNGGSERWEPLRQRRETIRRKGRAQDVDLTFHESDHGVLDGDGAKDGLHLATCWSGADSGSRSLSAIFAVFRAPDVAAGMEALGGLETAFNWVFADKKGEIGYQMSGLMPVRRPEVSGLVPLPGWDPANDWQGFVSPQDLPRSHNPADGYIVTANDDLNDLGRERPINLPMGPARAERIRSILVERSDWTGPEQECLQMEAYSLHAEGLMEVLEPLLPDTPATAVLRAWDRRYEPDSEGAVLFERLYRDLLLEVFSGAVGEQGMLHLLDETAVLADFHHCFDGVLLSETSVWFGADGRDEVFGRAARGALAEPAEGDWGSRQRFVMHHLLLGGRLPRWFGFDRGPFVLRGGRGTIHQGQLFRAGGRETTFAPSYRLVTDMAERSARTCLAGGPSDRRFSRWYASGVSDWLAGRFKSLGPR